MAYGELNAHVSEQRRHVTWKVNVVTPIHLEPNISKTAGDAIY